MILYLQQFIYQALTNNSIAKRVKGIHYQVPSGSAFPYIYIGDFSSKDISSKTEKIAEIHFKLIIYSRDKSQKFILELSEKIKNILDINGKERIAMLKCVEEKISLQHDGITQQISMKFKAIVE